MYNKRMYTIIETAIYLKHTAKFWNDLEREAFIEWIAENPDAGDVIPQTGGLRKVRFARKGMGKRGGARVIYMLRTERGELLLLAAYTKSDHETMSAQFLTELSKLYKE